MDRKNSWGRRHPVVLTGSEVSPTTPREPVASCQVQARAGDRAASWLKWKKPVPSDEACNMSLASRNKRSRGPRSLPLSFCSFQSRQGWHIHDTVLFPLKGAELLSPQALLVSPQLATAGNRARKACCSSGPSGHAPKVSASGDVHCWA